MKITHRQLKSLISEAYGVTLPSLSHVAILQQYRKYLQGKEYTEDFGDLTRILATLEQLLADTRQGMSELRSDVEQLKEPNSDSGSDSGLKESGHHRDMQRSARGSGRGNVSQYDAEKIAGKLASSNMSYGRRKDLESFVRSNFTSWDTTREAEKEIKEWIASNVPLRER